VDRTLATSDLPQDAGFRWRRWVRAFRRFRERLDARLALVRPMTGTLAALAFLAGWGVYGLVLTGEWRTTADALASAAGFSINSIEIRGLAEADSTEISDRIDVSRTNSLIMLDAEQARRRIAEIPWVADVTVRKVYPRRVVVELTERLPFALWQDEGRVKVVDRTGTVMSDVILTRHAGLPLVVGAGANVRVEEAVALIDAVPSLRPKIRAAVLVADRRWNLMTVDGVELLLPEEDPKAALARVADLQAAKKLLDRDVVSIDLRVPDRLFVRLSDAAADQRRDLMRAKTGQKKKGADT
jgi:cell division protein FtsQ